MSFSLANAVRSVSRAIPAYSTRSLGLVSKPVNRSLWYMSHPSSNQVLPKKLSSTFNQPGSSCSCGTACRGVHTRGDKELIEFLSEEIAAEKKTSSKSKLLSNVDGFDVELKGAEIQLSKKFNDEQVKITLNVNHSVDAELNEEELNAKADNAPSAEMKSRPQFEVRLIKGSQTTRFACSFVQDAGEPTDEGPKRGVCNDFAEKLSDLATKREHDLFVNLLERLQAFFQGK
uniref:EOG090X0APE n=1 Tax=Alona affinis TaxID=381656 RepID=A0A9N6ZDP1_9CRUS|nr:EOG090X0APE [Alona affinis]